MRVRDAVGDVADLGADARPAASHRRAVLLDRPAVLVEQVDDAGVAHRLEGLDHPVDGGLAAGALAGRDVDPRDGQRLPLAPGQRGRGARALGHRGRGAAQVLAGDGQRLDPGGREQGRAAAAEPVGDAAGTLGAQQAPGLAQPVRHETWCCSRTPWAAHRSHSGPGRARRRAGLTRAASAARDAGRPSAARLASRSDGRRPERRRRGRAVPAPVEPDLVDDQQRPQPRGRGRAALEVGGARRRRRTASRTRGRGPAGRSRSPRSRGRTTRPTARTGPARGADELGRALRPVGVGVGS